MFLSEPIARLALALDESATLTKLDSGAVCLWTTGSSNPREISARLLPRADPGQWRDDNAGAVEVISDRLAALGVTAFTTPGTLTVLIPQTTLELRVPGEITDPARVVTMMLDGS